MKNNSNTNRSIISNKNAVMESKKFSTSQPEKSLISGAGVMAKVRFNNSMTPLSITQATSYLGISRGALYRLMDARAIRSFHIGARHFITMAALNDFIRSQEEAENYGW